MLRKFTICIASSETQILAMVDRLEAAGFPTFRILTYPRFIGQGIGEGWAFTNASVKDWGPTRPCCEFGELGFPELEAHYYDDQVRSGGFAIWAESDDPEEVEQIRLIFEEASGENISIIPDHGRHAPVSGKAGAITRATRNGSPPALSGEGVSPFTLPQTGESLTTPSEPTVSKVEQEPDQVVPPGSSPTASSMNQRPLGRYSSLESSVPPNWLPEWMSDLAQIIH